VTNLFTVEQIHWGQRSGKRTWYDTMLKFDDLYESLKPLGLEGFLTQPFDLGIFDEKPRVTCAKCSGRNTRRHHRKCTKRGLGHKGREQQARNAEATCREYGFVARVRRGRHGKGVSLDKAECDVLRIRARICAPRDITRDAIYALYGRDAKIEIPEPGTISITTDQDADPRRVVDFVALGVRVVVNGVDL
jgi:hypothetical protein